MSLLYSENYKQFLSLLQADYPSMIEVISKIGEAVSYIADHIHLGRLEIYYLGPESPYEDKIEGKEDVYISKDGYEEKPYPVEYIIKAGGRAVMTYYPRKGEEFSEEDRENLTFINSSLVAGVGRIHVMELLEASRIMDPLTKLPNTMALRETVKDYCDKGIFENYTVFFSNIKNFSFFNQQMGSPVGDCIMKDYANLLKSFVEDDEFVSRLGGDNYIFIIKKSRFEEFSKLISRNELHINAGAGIQRTVIIETRSGVFDITEGKTYTDVMNCSSIALENAKKLNRRLVVFNPKMLEISGRERLIIAAFPEALKTRQFDVYYQPKVNLIHKTITGMEALVRWNRDGNVLLPSAFVPALERQGAIEPLDFYVLRRVCEDIDNWLKMGIEPVRVSVNFSKAHLRDENLARNIINTIREYKIDPSFIEIELTETTGYEDFEGMKRFIAILRENGIYTSLDDFGTGYSSLNLLTDFPVKVIKIDKSFVDNINKEGAPDRMVISTILRLIEELDMDVVAEGVETPDQARALLNMNCYNVQGFLFDKPLRCDIMTDKLKSGFKYQIEY
ncbi:MAG: bifunctional diguanylate cyclase/phosphodiesterase [Lachnospiraceae bacterium]|nr:bifunctional diguanylate cyclase/phosphodiesterase [Lachnospiraceae bacterium]